MGWVWKDDMLREQEPSVPGGTLHLPLRVAVLHSHVDALELAHRGVLRVQLQPL